MSFFPQPLNIIVCSAEKSGQNKIDNLKKIKIICLNRLSKVLSEANLILFGNLFKHFFCKYPEFIDHDEFEDTLSVVASLHRSIYKSFQLLNV